MNAKYMSLEKFESERAALSMRLSALSERAGYLMGSQAQHTWEDMARDLHILGWKAQTLAEACETLHAKVCDVCGFKLYPWYDEERKYDRHVHGVDTR